MVLSDWLVLGCIALVAFGIYKGKKKGEKLASKALAQARLDGRNEAAAMASNRVDLGGIHLGGREYGVMGGSGAPGAGGSLAGALDAPAVVPVLDGLGNVVAWRLAPAPTDGATDRAAGHDDDDHAPARAGYYGHGVSLVQGDAPERPGADDRLRAPAELGQRSIVRNGRAVVLARVRGARGDAAGDAPLTGDTDAS